MNEDTETAYLRSLVTPETWATLEQIVAATYEDDIAEIRMAVLELPVRGGDGTDDEERNAVVRRALLRALMRAAPAVAARTARRTRD